MWRTGTLGLPSAPAMALHARAPPPMRSGCCRHAAKAPLLLLPRLSGNAHGTSSSGRCIVACRASGSSSEHSRRNQDSPHGFGAGGGSSSSGGSAVSPSTATTSGDVSCKATAAAAAVLPPFPFPATPPGKQPQALHSGPDTTAGQPLPGTLSSAQTNGDTEQLPVAAAAAAAAATQYGLSVARGSDQPATPTVTTDAAAIRQEHTSSTTHKSSSSSSSNGSGNSSATALASSAETSAGILTGNHRSSSDGSGGNSSSCSGSGKGDSSSSPVTAVAAAPLLPSPSSPSSQDAAINTALAAALAAAAAFKFVTVDFESWGRLPVWDLLMQMPDSNWRAYVAAVDANPLLTKACISGIVYTLGDCIAQVYEGRGIGGIDRARAARSGVCGFIAHGPLSHLYYEALDYWFVSVLQVPSSTATATLSKLVIDQTIWSIFWNSTYYVLLGLLKAEPPSTIIQTVRSSWFDLLKAGWKLWPFAHVLTYSVIPTQHRLLWVDSVELVWVTYLSFYGQQQRGKMAEEAAAAGGGGPIITQVALPGPDGLGGDPAEELLRSIEVERRVAPMTDATAESMRASRSDARHM